jgi:hypothetical protein
MLPVHTAIRYVTPLREGGSLPAVVETAEDGLWVVKFRGAGQGAKMLVAEIIVGLIALRIGLPVPDLSLVEVAPSFGRTEGDPEIQDLLRWSDGINVGLRYLDGAFNYEERPSEHFGIVPRAMKAQLLWLDGLVFNPDRTHRNPNLLIWNRKPWLIDHGSTLYFHHNWARMTPGRARGPFEPIRDHLFLRDAPDLADADDLGTETLDEPTLREVLSAVPDSLLNDPVSGETDAPAEELRARYVEVLLQRLQGPRDWVDAIRRAQGGARTAAPRRLEARR